jgi:hypothetical protein
MSETTEHLSSNPVVAAVQSELARQGQEGDWHAPWVGNETETTVQVDGDIDIPALIAVITSAQLATAKADAWDEGHETPWKRGPDDCECGAWGHNECLCGRYGTVELLSLKENPYRAKVAE